MTFGQLSFGASIATGNLQFLFDQGLFPRRIARLARLLYR
jgi:hypothetical protein